MAIIRPATGEADVRALARVLEASFSTRSPWDPWLDRIGVKNLRVIEEGGAIAGGLGVYRMGQWFGGSAVPLAGITGVGVALEHRGRGLANKLMRAALTELAPSFPLAGLYASTATLYRGVGFEQAGTRLTYAVAPDRLPRGDHALPAREIELSRWQELAPLYDARARSWSGHLDRSAAIWERVVGSRPEMPVQAYAVGEPIEGYVVLARGPLEGHSFVIQLRDLVFSSARGARRLLALLRDSSSLCRRIEWSGCAADPLISLLPEEDHEVIAHTSWMLRILDVKAALEARGYPPLSSEVHLRVRDELFPSNAGDFVLAIDHGRARVERGGEGALEIDVRALAALYTGFAHPSSLSDLLSGDARPLAQAFAGPEPWCCDHY